MPLPPAAPRKAVHTRSIDCRGYEREDGLWDIEGRLVDTKAFHWRRREGMADLPAGVDACGENGEFHTCVTAGPMFTGALDLQPGEIVTREPFVWADLNFRDA